MPAAIAIATAVGLGVGVLTSIGQTLLPEAIASLANAAAPWSLVAFAVAAVTGGGRVGRSAILGVLALVAMLAGYDLATLVRGFAVSAGITIFWIVMALVAGPPLGIGAAWIRGSDPRRAAAGIAAPAAILIGEGVYGLTVIAATTSPVYWTIQLLAGVGSIVAISARLGSWAALALSASLASIGAAAFLVAYTNITSLF